MPDGSVLIDTKLDPKGLQDGLNKLGNDAEKSTGKLSKALGAFGKAAGVALAAIGTGLVAASKYVVETGIAFESAFAGVKKTVEATPAQLEKLRQGILDLSTTMPMAATEIAAIAEAAGQLGIETDNILGFTKVMADLGVATNMTATEAATQLARFANITGMAQTDFDKLGSTIVALGNNLATTESEIVDMAMRLAGAGEQVGMSEHQIMALSASLSSLGVNAEAGGSAMSRVLSKMNSAVIGNGSELKKYAKIAGVSAKEFAAAWKEDPMQALMLFTGGLDKIAQAGGDVDKALKSVGFNDIRISDMLKRMAGNEEALAAALDLANEAWENNNALLNEANQRYQTMESQLVIFKNNIAVLGIAIYDSLREPLAQSLQMVNGWVRELHEGFTKGGLNGLLGAAGAVLGELISEVTKAAPKLAKASVTVIKSLTSTLKKNAKPIAAAAAEVGVSLVEGIVDVLPDILELGVEVVVALVEGIAGALPSLIPMAAEMMVSIATGLIRAVPKLVAAIPKIAAGLIEGFRNVDWAGLWDSLVDGFTQAWEEIKTFGGELLDTLKAVNWSEVGQKILDGIETVLQNAGAFIKRLITGDENATWPEVGQALLNGIRYILAGAATLVKRLVTGDENATWPEVGQALWNGIKQKLSNIAGTIKGWLGLDPEASWTEVGFALWNGIKAKLSNLSDTIRGWLGLPTNATWTEVGTALWNGISQKLSNLGATIKGWITGDTTASWGDVGTVILQGIRTGLGSIGSAIKRMITGDQNAGWSDVGTALWNGIKEKLSNIADTIKGWLGFAPETSWTEVGLALWKGIKEKLGQATANLKTWLGITDDMSYTEIGSAIIKGIQEKLGTFLTNVKTWLGIDGDLSFPEIGNAISGGIQGAINGIAEFIGSEGFRGAATAVIGGVASAITNTVAHKATLAQALIDLIIQGVGSAEFGELMAAIGNSMVAAISALGDITSAIVGWILSPSGLQTIGNAGIEIIVALSKGITLGLLSLGEGILNAVGSLLGSLATMVAGWFGIETDFLATKVGELVFTAVDAQGNALVDAAGEVVQKTGGALKTALEDQNASIVERAQALAALTAAGLGEAYQQYDEQYFNAGAMVAQRVIDGMNDASDPEAVRAMAYLIANGMAGGLQEKYPELYLAGVNLEASLEQGIVQDKDQLLAYAHSLGIDTSMTLAEALYSGYAIITEGANQTAEAFTNAVAEIEESVNSVELDMTPTFDSLFATTLSSVSAWKEDLKSVLSEMGVEAGSLLGVALPEGVAQGLADGTMSVEKAAAAIVEAAKLAEGDVEAAKQENQASGKTAGEGTATGETEAVPAVTTASEGIHDAVTGPISPIAEEVPEVGATAMSALETSISDGADPIATASQTVSDAAVQQFLLIMSAENGALIGNTFVQAIIDAINALGGAARNAAYVLASNALTIAQSALSYGAGYSIGQNFGQGLANGIDAMYGSVQAAAERIANAAAAAAQAALAIRSPSRLMFWVGEMFGEGFAQGVDDKRDDAVASAEALVGALPDKAFESLSLEVLINEENASKLARRMQEALDREQLTIAARANVFAAGAGSQGHDDGNASNPPIVIYGDVIIQPENMDNPDDFTEAMRDMAYDYSRQARYRGVVTRGTAR